MSIKTYKPTTPSRRHMTVSGFDGIDKKAKPEASLTEILKKNAGRNSYGRITVRHRGGRQTSGNTRIIDFKRDKVDMEATVLRLEYDPNRSANIALVQYEDGEKRYILAPAGAWPPATRCSPVPPPTSSPATPCPLPTSLWVPLTTTSRCIPARAASLVRSAGAAAQLMAKEGGDAQIRMPSGEVRIVQPELHGDHWPGG